MDRHSLPSIEKFAAFLDGNLSQNEMQQFSQLADYDDALHELLDASSIVDETIAGFTDADLQLPPEIAGSDFELPEIEDSDKFSLVDEIFNELDNETIDDDEIIESDIERDLDIDDDYDNDFFDADI